MNLFRVRLAASWRHTLNSECLLKTDCSRSVAAPERRRNLEAVAGTAKLRLTGYACHAALYCVHDPPRSTLGLLTPAMGLREPQWFKDRGW